MFSSLSSMGISREVLFTTLDRVEVAEVAVGHLLEQGARRAEQGGLHIRAREDEERQAATPSASSTTV